MTISMGATFWLVAIVLTALASAFIIVPMLGRSRQTWSRTRINAALYKERLRELASDVEESRLDEATRDALAAELQRDLLLDTDMPDEAEPVVAAPRTPAWVMAALVPILAISLYAAWGGSLGSIDGVALAADLRQMGDHDEAGASSIADRLALQMNKQPDNHQGWYLLGQSMTVLSRYDEAALAFEHLREAFPGDVELMVRSAEAGYLAAGKRMTVPVQDLLEGALAINPHHLSALELLGMDAIQNGDRAGAAGYFQRALASGVGGERGEIIRAVVKRLSMESSPPAAGEQLEGVGSALSVAEGALGEGAVEARATGRSIRILVEADSKVSAADSHTVYVFARAVGGPPMPLAVERFPVRDLPRLVTLDESMTMMPGHSLATATTIELVARISASGLANATGGEPEVRSGEIRLADFDGAVVKLVIQPGD